MKFSIIIVSYSYKRINYLKKALSALKRQTYKNIEIILVLNGFDKNLKRFSDEWLNFDQRNKLLFFNKNYDLKNDNVNIGKYRYRKGIEISSGDYIFCQSDDDFVSEDFFEKMFNVFNNNKDCQTALGLPIDYFWDNETYIKPKKGLWFSRSTYTHGKKLFLEWIQNRDLIFNPGFCYVIKRDLFFKHIQTIWYGYDFSVFMTIVPCGVTGFDKTAYMYWGRHKAQENNRANINHYKNFIYLKPSIIRNKYALKIWKKQNSKPSDIKKLKIFQQDQLTFFSTHGFYYNIKRFNLKNCIRHIFYIKNKIFFIKILFLEIKRDFIRLFKMTI